MSVCIYICTGTFVSVRTRSLRAGSRFTAEKFNLIVCRRRNIKSRNSLFTFDFPRPKGFIRKSNPSDRRTLIRVRIYVSVSFFPRLRRSVHVDQINSVSTLIRGVSFVFYFIFFFKSIAKIRSRNKRARD